MKKNVLFITALLITLSSFCQNYNVGDTIYYKDNIISTKKNTNYFAVINSKKIIENEITNSLSGYEYSKDSLKFYLKHKYTSNNLKTIAPKGLTIYFYKNGNKFAQGNINEYGEQVGKWIFWRNDNRKLEERNHHNKHKPPKIISFWNKKGIQTIVNGNGYYEHLHNAIISKGNYKNGYKIGKWNGYKNNQKYYEENYKKGKLITGTSWDKEGTEYTYNTIFEAAKYLKGKKSISKFFSKNLSDSNNSIIKFKILKNGDVGDINITESSCSICDEKTIKKLKEMKKWKPQKFRGQKEIETMTFDLSHL